MTGALQFTCPACQRTVGAPPVTTSVACRCGAVFDLTIGRAGASVMLRRDESEEITCTCGAVVAIGHIPRWSLLIDAAGNQYPGELHAYPCSRCEARIPIPPRPQPTSTTPAGVT